MNSHPITAMQDPADWPSVEIKPSWVVQFFLSTPDIPRSNEDDCGGGKGDERRGGKGEDQEQHSTPEPLVWAYAVTVLVYGVLDLVLRHTPWVRSLYRSIPEWASALLVLGLFQQTLSILRIVAVGLYWLDVYEGEREAKEQCREESAVTNDDCHKQTFSNVTITTPSGRAPSLGCLDKTGRFVVLEEMGEPNAPLEGLIMLRPIWLTQNFFQFCADEEQRCKKGGLSSASPAHYSPTNGEGPVEAVARFLETCPFFGKKNSRLGAGGSRLNSRDLGAAGGTASSSKTCLVNYRYFLDTEKWLLLLASATRPDGTVDAGLIHELEQRGRMELLEIKRDTDGRDQTHNLPRSILERFQLHSCAVCGKEEDKAGQNLSSNGTARTAGKKRRTPTTILSTCSGCRSFAYCSSFCQKQHWSDGHKFVCLKRKNWL
jgi:hypothetical protein